MTTTTVSLKLDRPRELRFTMPSIIALCELTRINLYDPASYDFRNPVHLRDIMWAGQLDTKKPLTRLQVGTFLPSDVEELGTIIQAVALAVARALDKDYKPKNDKAPQSTSPV